jgi:hypothetical protein
LFEILEEIKSEGNQKRMDRLLSPQRAVIPLLIAQAHRHGAQVRQVALGVAGLVGDPFLAEETA